MRHIAARWFARARWSGRRGCVRRELVAQRAGGDVVRRPRVAHGAVLARGEQRAVIEEARGDDAAGVAVDPGMAARAVDAPQADPAVLVAADQPTAAGPEPHGQGRGLVAEVAAQDIARGEIDEGDAAVFGRRDRDAGLDVEIVELAADRDGALQRARA